MVLPKPDSQPVAVMQTFSLGLVQKIGQVKSFG